jgi:hypothetical protein
MVDVEENMWQKNDICVFYIQIHKNRNSNFGNN